MQGPSRARKPLAAHLPTAKLGMSCSQQQGSSCTRAWLTSHAHAMDKGNSPSLFHVEGANRQLSACNYQPTHKQLAPQPQQKILRHNSPTPHLGKPATSEPWRPVWLHTQSPSSHGYQLTAAITKLFLPHQCCQAPSAQSTASAGLNSWNLQATPWQHKNRNNCQQLVTTPTHPLSLQPITPRPEPKHVSRA